MRRNVRNLTSLLVLLGLGTAGFSTGRILPVAEDPCAAEAAAVAAAEVDLELAEAALTAAEQDLETCLQGPGPCNAEAAAVAAAEVDVELRQDALEEAQNDLDECLGQTHGPDPRFVAESNSLGPEFSVLASVTELDGD